jgi:hypothetical protein
MQRSREDNDTSGSTWLDRNEGVGEHVRTRFHSGKKAGGKLRTRNADPHRTKKASFFCGTGLEVLAPQKFDPAV